MEIKKLIEEYPVLRDIQDRKEVIWTNPELENFETAGGEMELSLKNVEEAEERLLRFAPFIRKSCTGKGSGRIQEDIFIKNKKVF